MEAMEVRGYKVFNPDWTCTPNGNKKQYTCPGKFEEDVTLVRCGLGMHFCKKASDCFNYYSFHSANKVAEVIARGKIIEEGDKCCTDKLEIVREIPWAELLTIVNEGTDCTGLCNTGNRNTGDWNTGNRNTGNRNTGDWNKSSFNTGCFNTTELTINFFNKPSSWTYRDWLNSEARYLLNEIPKNVVGWVYSQNMTDEEKALHPTYETTGGYLKVLDEADRAVKWWAGLNDDKKKIILNIPNFDKTIFKEITGIDVDG